jgi:uncharacterized protein (DUF362 family)
MKRTDVQLEECRDYDQSTVDEAFRSFEPLFDASVRPGDRVVLKPNWIAPNHRYKHDEWESVITHPAVVTAVVRHVARRLNGKGSITITDGPQTENRFDKIMGRMSVQQWRDTASEHGIDLTVLDLREMEWEERGDVIFNRRPLPGDPLGSVEFNLRDHSNFVGHSPSSKGYYGADYDNAETTAAHTNGNHRYRVAGTVIDADLFINLPKLKTHKKAGITCSLKNLVGINTYKNFLPHHTEGTPAMGGDQFPGDSVRSMSEVYLLNYFKQAVLKHHKYGKLFIPLKKAGRLIFGETQNQIRSGNWYGNNTLWRTILDLNALLLYGNLDGTLRAPAMDQQKRYISIIDGVVAGDGNGPEAPDRFPAGLLIGGSNPLSVDCAAAKVMGFDYRLVPSVYGGFKPQHFPILDAPYESIHVRSATRPAFNGPLHAVPLEACYRFRAHFGWTGHIEASDPGPRREGRLRPTG